MSIGRFIKFEALRNLRLDDALRPQIEYLLAPAADATYLAPKVGQIHAEDALVGADERHRIEPKPGRASKHSQHIKDAPLLVRHCRRNAEHTEPPGRREQPISLSERVATDGIENEFDTAAIGDFARSCLEILRAVVDQVIDAESSYRGVCGQRCRADDGGADMSCDLICGYG